MESIFESIFYVIAEINGTSYVTKLNARNAAHAEHQIIDMCYCGKHEYGVEACCAYDTDAMRTEAFASALYFAEPVSVVELVQLIEERNAEIKLNEMAEARKDEINQQIKALRSQIAALEDELKEVERESMKNETREAIKFCARLYALLPELREEYNNTMPEWKDEKALNETLCWMVKTIEKL